MDSDRDETQALIGEFLGVVDSVVGVYLDGREGFRLLLNLIKKRQQQTIRMLEDTEPEIASVEYLDSLPLFYGKGDPNTPGAQLLHQRTQGQVKERNEAGGSNRRFLGAMFLVTVYQYWEDRYRARIASSIGIAKNELKAPIMGDLRRLRKSILHHGGIALPEVKKCEILRWFEPDTEIVIDQPEMEEIVRQIELYLRQLVAERASEEAADEQRPSLEPKG